MQYAQIGWTSIATGSFFILFAMAFSLVLKVSKIWNFAQPAAMAIAFYAMLWAASTLSQPLAVIIIFGLVATVSFNVGLERIGFNSLRRRKAPSMTFFIFTLIVTEFISYVVTLVFGAQGYTLYESIISPTHRVWSLFVTNWDITAVSVCGFLLIFYAIFMRYTKSGRRLLAVSNNPWLAELYGINVKRVFTTTMVISSVFIVGGMYLMGTRVTVTPGTGLLLIIETVAATIIGGIGNVWGAALAAVGIRFLQGFSVLFLPSLWQGFVVYLVLFVLIIAIPQGLPSLVGRIGARKVAP